MTIVATEKKIGGVWVKRYGVEHPNPNFRMGRDSSPQGSNGMIIIPSQGFTQVQGFSYNFGNTRKV